MKSPMIDVSRTSSTFPARHCAASRPGLSVSGSLQQNGISGRPGPGYGRRHRNSGTLVTGGSHDGSSAPPSVHLGRTDRLGRTDPHLGRTDRLGWADAHLGGSDPLGRFPPTGRRPRRARYRRDRAAGPAAIRTGMVDMSIRFAILIAAPPLAGAVFGYLSGGRIKGLLTLRVRALWLVWLAAAAQLAQYSVPHLHGAPALVVVF